MIKPAVFLDRDNTLIHNDGDLGDPDRVVLMKGAASAVASLRGLGYRIVVITNQGGVARGHFTEDDVHAVHDRIDQLLAPTNGAIVDRYYYCPFHPEGRLSQYTREHPNRKPQPGMLLDAAREMKLDLSQSWMIGDQVRDIQAGKAAGVRTILLREDAPHLVPLDVDATAGVENMPPPPPNLTWEAEADENRGDSADAKQSDGIDPAALRPERGGNDQPHYYARSLIEAVRLVAQQRKPEAAGELAAEERATRKWDAQAVARMREQRQAEGGKGSDDRGGRGDQGGQGGQGDGRKRVMVGTSSTSRRSREGNRPFEPAGHYHERPHEKAGESEDQAGQVKDKEKTKSKTNAETESKAQTAAAPEPADEVPPPLTDADTRVLEPHELGEPEAKPASQPTDAATPPIKDAAAMAAEVDSKDSADANPSSASAITTEKPPARKPARTPPAEATLRQILQELRDIRAQRDDFSYAAMLAVVLQVVAVVCLAGGLILAADSGEFFRWLGGGVMAQLAAITAVLFARSR